MKPNFLLKAGLACIGIDIAFRLVALWYWLYSPESTPGLPFIYKGIKYPEIQVSIFIADILMVSAAIYPAWRTQRLYFIFSIFCAVAAAIIFLGGLFYSNNVAGSAGGFLAASLGFNGVRKSWQLKNQA